MSDFKYDAFICYRDIDELDSPIALKIQKKLEKYKAPKGTECIYTNKIEKIYRYENEFKADNDLRPTMFDALKNSRFLIVVFTENTLKSPLCRDEIHFFKEFNMQSTKKIISIVADGIADKVISPELYSSVLEIGDHAEINVTPVYIEISKTNNQKGSKKQAVLKNIDNQILRVAATVLGCDYDDLNRRHHKRRVSIISAVSTIFVLLSLSVAIVIGYYANNSKNANASLYYKQGIESIDKTNNRHLALMYFSNSLKLNPKNVRTQTASLAMLLQNHSWAFVTEESTGRVIDDTLVVHESEKKNPSDVLTLNKSVDLKQIVSVNKGSNNVLVTQQNGGYYICDKEGNFISSVEKDSSLLSSYSLGWVFVNKTRLLVFNCNQNKFTEIDMQTELNSVFRDLKANMLDVMLYDNGNKLAVLTKGNLYFYEFKIDKYIETKIISVEELFTPPEDIFNTALKPLNTQYLSEEYKLYIDSNEKLLAVTNSNMFSVITLSQKQKLFEAKSENQYIISNVSFSKNSLNIGVSFGADPKLEIYANDGGFAVYDVKGNRLCHSNDSLQESVANINFANDLKTFCTYDYDKTVRFWRFENNTLSEACTPLNLSTQVKNVIFFDHTFAFAIENKLGEIQFYNLIKPKDSQIVNLKDKRYPIIATIQTSANEVALLTENSLWYVNIISGSIINSYIKGDAEFTKFIIDNQLNFQKLGKIGDKENIYAWIDTELISSLTTEFIKLGVALGSDIISDLMTTKNKLFVTGNDYPYIASYQIENSHLKLLQFRLIENYSPTEIWISKNEKHIFVSTTNNEVLVFSSDNLFEPPKIIKLTTKGKLEEVTSDDTLSFLAVSILANNQNFKYSTLEVWDVNANANVLTFTDKESNINGLYFYNDFIYFGVEDTFNKKWMPTVGITEERNRFFSSLSGYKLDKLLVPQVVPVTDKIITQIENDSWSELYEIKNSF